MIRRQRSRSRRFRGGLVFAFLISLFFCGSYVFGTQPEGLSGPPRYRIFALKQIPAEEGRKYLTDAGIDATVSQLRGTNTLLVTAEPYELIKATVVLNLIDSGEKFVMKAIFPVSEVQSLPPKEQIEAEIRDISIGTFLDPPRRGAKVKAILDIHGDSVVAIAPAGVLGEITAAIERLRVTRVKTAPPAAFGKSGMPGGSSEAALTEGTKGDLRGPGVEGLAAREAKPARAVALGLAKGRPDANRVESDELFNELLSSMGEAEPVTAGPAKPGVAAVAPEARIAEEVLMNSERPVLESGTGAPGARGRETMDLAAVIERLRAEKGIDTEPEPVAQPEPGQGAVEVPLPEVVVEEKRAPRSYEPGSVPNGEEVLDLILPEKLEITQLLGLVGEYLHLDYMYDPTKVKGDVALKLKGKLSGPIQVKDLYPLLESVMQFKGFVMTRKRNLVTIRSKEEVLKIDPALLADETGQVKVGDVIVTRIFKLNYIDTATAQTLLKDMQLGETITTISETGTLIVTGYAYRMGRIEELLTIIDKPGKAKKYKFRQLQFTMAATLAPQIKTLADELGTVSITIGTTAPAPRAPVAPTRPVRGRPATPARKPTVPTGAAAKPTVYIDADERTNRILMIGLTEQLDIVDELIDSLDVEQQDLRALRVYDIQHVGAEEVEQKLAELGIISSVGRSTTGIGRPRPATPTKSGAKAPPSTTGRITSSPQEILAEEPQVVVIESTNSLLVNATAEQHARIALIISYVDSQTLEQAIPYKIYKLENQKPEDLASVLQKLIQETVKDKTGKTETTAKRGEDIVIVPDEGTFSLIVYASKKNQEWIGKLIKTLDKRRPQVLVDVTLVEVSRTDLFDLDLQMVTKFPHLVPDTDFLTPLFTDANSNRPIPRRTIIEASAGAGTGLGFYADSHIQALLTAMQTKSYGRILAKPKILVNDGQPGTIETKDTTNIRIEDVLVPDEGTARTTSKFQEYDAGITLTITPNISEGDLLLLEVELIRSDFLEPPDAGSPPDKTESNINTIVTVPNDRTIILGGLLKLNQAKGGSKVPLLSDIPLLGGLFRATGNSARDSKLYIFVKANILRPDEALTGLPELEQISARNAAAFEKFEEKFQGYEDWPGIKPKPMEPLKVLEAE